MPEVRIDTIDRKILAILQQDAHTTMEKLAAAVGLSPSPCARRVRNLEASGVIKRYVAVVDQDKAGLPVSVFASIRLERQREDELDRFAKAIARWPEIVECYLMTGQRDYLLRIVVKDLPAYEAFLKRTLTRLDGVASIESSFALSQVKHAQALPME
ncbi:Lrp/AsnC family transcriptional regulator [Ancylobacter polymorphus]|uniref:Lrp/AsnC family transcriptional regulator n=1 Tax=Ancylobacter polymorphus TaxID=223390 RepID=A0A9E6ZW48_9HYPH|nr:Lrp/AsnC family transcriptional regulator [Ancylobacter polymorphus]UOK72821.1 Lrp/AsnC family transcriptional regulator [Ancylobacter polymorphus]